MSTSIARELSLIFSIACAVRRCDGSYTPIPRHLFRDCRYPAARRRGNYELVSSKPKLANVSDWIGEQWHPDPATILGVSD